MSSIRSASCKLLCLAAVFLMPSCAEEPAATSPRQDALMQLLAAPEEKAGDPDGANFSNEKRAVVLPEDRGAHPDHRLEWWYYTGNLYSADGRRFGYQLTFFRTAFIPKRETKPRESRWAATEVMQAHFTVTDIEDSAFYQAERRQRVALNLAGTRDRPFRIWVEDWSMQEENARVRLTAAHAQYSIDLHLIPQKPTTLHGDKGYLEKTLGAERRGGYYYSITRMQTDGIITINDKRFTVSGLSWFDHEWGSGFLTADHEGWDWFSLHLGDGRDLMVYLIRRRRGQIEKTSFVALIDTTGDATVYDHSRFNLEALDWWRSPVTRRIYPAKWRLSVPEADLDLEITPQLSDQEVRGLIIYWEGAVKITDGTGKGYGYAELTGYASGREKPGYFH